MSALTFTKRPVDIEAMQWDGTRESIEACCRWVNDECPRPPLLDNEEDDGEPPLTYVFSTAADCGWVIEDVSIGTMEGYLTVSAGDWIIRGVAGEFYPCKPDIFAATYEPDDDRSWCPCGALVHIDDARYDVEGTVLCVDCYDDADPVEATS